MTYVKMGAVRAFPGARPDKAQALKVLEEAAEVFGAWQARESYDTDAIGEIYTPEQCMIIHAVNDGHLLDEIADTVQACANLAAALGVTDLAPYMAECGAHLEVDGDTDANLLVGGERPMPNYCPNCGAKVEVGK